METLDYWVQAKASNIVQVFEACAGRIYHFFSEKPQVCLICFVDDVGYDGSDDQGYDDGR